MAKFEQLARELEADEDEAAFDEILRKIAPKTLLKTDMSSEPDA